MELLCGESPPPTTTSPVGQRAISKLGASANQKLQKHTQPVGDCEGSSSDDPMYNFAKKSCSKSHCHQEISEDDEASADMLELDARLGLRRFRPGGGLMFGKRNK